ncbi:MAG TPA: RraA family protein [Candidatus Methylacidiphilales bacterium]
MPATPSQAASLAALDTPLVSNAVDSLGLRLRNEGFADHSIACRFPDRPPLVGHAVTIRIRSAKPPIEGGHFVERTDWWSLFESVPAPRILVVEDVDPVPGTGALLGAIHAHLFSALGVAGAVTNGAARGLPEMERLGFGLFSGSLAVGRAYAHVVGAGMPVRIGGLRIEAGTLLHGDRHGLLALPEGSAEYVLEAARHIAERESRIAALCAAPGITPERIREIVAEHNALPGVGTRHGEAA